MGAPLLLFESTACATQLALYIYTSNIHQGPRSHGLPSCLHVIAGLVNLSTHIAPLSHALWLSRFRFCPRYSKTLTVSLLEDARLSFSFQGIAPLSVSIWRALAILQAATLASLGFGRLEE